MMPEKKLTDGKKKRKRKKEDDFFTSEQHLSSSDLSDLTSLQACGDAAPWKYQVAPAV